MLADTQESVNTYETVQPTAKTLPKNFKVAVTQDPIGNIIKETMGDDNLHFDNNQEQQNSGELPGKTKNFSSYMPKPNIPNLIIGMTTGKGGGDESWSDPEDVVACGGSGNHSSRLRAESTSTEQTIGSKTPHGKSDLKSPRYLNKTSAGNLLSSNRNSTDTWDYHGDVAEGEIMVGPNFNSPRGPLYRVSSSFHPAVEGMEDLDLSNLKSPGAIDDNGNSGSVTPNFKSPRAYLNKPSPFATIMACGTSVTSGSRLSPQTTPTITPRYEGDPTGKVRQYKTKEVQTYMDSTDADLVKAADEKEQEIIKLQKEMEIKAKKKEEIFNAYMSATKEGRILKDRKKEKTK
eukprot:TRINITY_DN5056_c0_g1_i1.p2 TRINITY_DN5056_c0_g1~~TRINITY_DN5056_c0_g1_i1.p2  ORF type:complete len:347 (-),score=94.75 TRINITY_DN5056_c0_g1_i1:103-1143(-)